MQLTKTMNMQDILLASLSCLTYLRELFDEKCYNNTTLCGVTIKQLKRNSSSASDRFLDWIEIGVFDAIKLGYLKKLVIGIYLDDKTANKVTETYTFDFVYDNEVVNNTESVSKLIQTLCELTKSLQPLPNIKFLTMKLFYNKSTPISYEPSLFGKATNHTFSYVSEPLKLDVGGVRADRCETFLNITTVCDSPVIKNIEPKKMKTNEMKFKTPKIETKEEIKCVCSININDGDMLQCDKCMAWLHTICCGYFSNDDKRIPSGDYVCDLCLNIEDKEMLRNVAFDRKILSAIYNENCKDETKINIRLGINMELVRKILVKFEGEGFLVKNGKTYDIMKGKDVKEKIKTYFSIDIFDEKSSLPIEDIKCIKQ